MKTAIWIYPWDLLDAGPDRVLEELKDHGISGVSVAVAYHSARVLLPHNPQRKVYFVEDGVVYFRPDPSCYRGLWLGPKPAAICAGRDPLKEITAAARRADLEVNAWAVCLHNSRLGTAHPDCTVINCFGESYRYALCPSNPDVRGYVVALCRDLSGRYDLDALELEAVGSLGYRHRASHDKMGLPLDDFHVYLLSNCFCPHCSQSMRERGLDPARLMEASRRELTRYFEDGSPGAMGEGAVRERMAALVGAETLESLIAVHNDAVLTLVHQIRNEVPGGIGLHVIASVDPFTRAAEPGVDLWRLSEDAGAVILTLFSKRCDILRRKVRLARKKGGQGLRILASLRACWPDSPDEASFLRKVRAVRDAGADGLRVYHYGLMPKGNLAWVRRAVLEEAASREVPSV